MEKLFRNNFRTIMDPDGTYSPLSNYSDRTSIHVHTNVQDLTLEQMASLCLLYQVFERVLFQFIGGERKDNIFCVPWHECLISNRTIKSFLEDGGLKLREWQKYTALNLLPVQTQGTVEWRHMAGNCDIEYITTWLKIIGAIYRAVRQNTFDELLNMFISLNSNSQYDMVFHRIFFDVPNFRRGDYTAMMEAGVLDLKYDWIG